MAKSKRTGEGDLGAARLASIAEKVRGLEAPFSCGGDVTLEAPVELKFKTGKPLVIHDVIQFPRVDVAKKLMRHCKPAPFGVGSETRHDARVREGGQLLAADGALRVLGLDLETTGILEEVRRVLCPDDAHAPSAELYALNVYDRLGHFVTHKDTPRDPAVFGTLVVCLPMSFRGGDLVLRHETTRVHAWASARSYHRPENDPYRVRWAAFYGDVDHRIERVTEGTRVTLTYNLRRTEGATAAKRAPSASEVDVARALVEAVRDRMWMPRGGTIGLPCVHLYAVPKGSPLAVRALTEQAAEALKGTDRLVALAALRAGLKPHVRPYLYETCAGQTWRLAHGPTEGERRIFARKQLGASKLAETLPIEHHAEWDEPDDVTWVLPPPWTSRRDRSHDAEPETELLGEVEYSATDYFGNEGGDSAFYVAAALLIHVPPAKEREVTGA